VANTDADQSDTGPERVSLLFKNVPYDCPEGRLRERVKELHCLYRVLELTCDNATPIEAICAKIVEVLPRGLLHESRAIARIQIYDFDLQSQAWQPTNVAINHPIRCESDGIGILSVGYINADTANPEFLPEEYDLVAAVAGNLGRLAENRLLLERIRDAERARTSAEMTGCLAHDFNNLLTVIIGSVESLREDLPDSNSTQDYLQLIAEAAERGSTLTAQLLAYSRRQPLSPQIIATGQMLRSLEPILMPAPGSAIHLEIDVPRDVWPVQADRAQLENALLNLAINAREAMPGGGRFAIAVSNLHLVPEQGNGEPLAEGDYVRFEVSDTGPGMTDAVASRAFDPYFTTKERGTGLGLSSVFGFVRQSHGWIRLHTKLGHGTRFLLYLPRAREEANAADASAARLR
jgi:signal transduction histidine kinase